MEQFYTKITSFFGTLQTRENTGKSRIVDLWKNFHSLRSIMNTEGVKRDNSLNNIRRSVEFHVF